jgi:DNA-binding Lrp family transcriptional regulator
MDALDRQILEILQQDGKMGISELGRIIGLSTTATKERVKKLETEGYIERYSAVLNSEKMGYGLTAFITVPVGDIDIIEMGERLVAMPQVQECHKVTGSACFLIKVKAENARDLEKTIDQINQYAKNTYTYIALSTLKETLELEVK